MNAPQGLWTPLELVRVSAEYLADRGIQSARLDAELLLAHVLDTDRMTLYVDHGRPVIASELDRYRALLKRRGQRIPLQLLVGDVEIYGRRFEVAEGVFIPRPDTETLIRRCLELFGETPPASIVELGVGTGCVGLNLLAEWPEARLLGFDLSDAAIELTRRNAEALGVADRLELRTEDALAADFGPCDLLVSNPPYVAESERADLEPEVVDHDPAAALFAANDGYAVIEGLAQKSSGLREGGWLVLEHGSAQGARVREILAGAGLNDVATVEDLAGQERVSAGRR